MPGCCPIGFRSEGHWGYPSELLSKLRGELTVTPELIEAGVIVAEAEHRLLGFAAMSRTDQQTAELWYLFVEPSAIGCGVGRLLWQASLAEARRAGLRRMRIESDPHAAEFYEAMGARLLGENPSGSVSGRLLPVFEVSL